jgi:anti-sigma factor RsiW
VAASCCVVTSASGGSVAERHVAGDRLSAFLDDELDDDTALVVARHLAGCARCHGELEGLRATRDALRALPLLHAPVLTGELRRSSRIRPAGRLRTVAVAGVVPILLLVTLYLAGAGGAEPQSELLLVEHVGRGPTGAPAGGG